MAHISRIKISRERGEYKVTIYGPAAHGRNKVLGSAHLGNRAASKGGNLGKAINELNPQKVS